MNSVKEEIRALADVLPEDATLEDAMQALYVRKLIDEGRNSVAASRTYSTEEIKSRIDQWFHWGGRLNLFQILMK